MAGEDKFLDSMMSEINTEDSPQIPESSPEPIGNDVSFDSDDGDDDGIEDTFFSQKGKSSKSESSDEPRKSNTPSNEAVIKYKANGQELSLDMSTEDGRKKAAEALSLMTASRQAMTNASKERKKAQELSQQVEANKEAVEKFGFLQQLAESGKTKELWKAMTGEDFDDALESYARKKILWQQAENDPQLKKQLMEREELETIRKEYDSIKKKQESESKARIEQDAQHQEDFMTNLIGGEFVNAMRQFESMPSEELNDVKEMVWSSALSELVRLEEKKYDVKNPKLVRQVIEKYAKRFSGLVNKKAEAQADAIIDTKKKDAKEKAQVASTDKYPKKGSEDTADMSKMNPKELFKHLTGRR